MIPRRRPELISGCNLVEMMGDHADLAGQLYQGALTPDEPSPRAGASAGTG